MSDFKLTFDIGKDKDRSCALITSLDSNGTTFVHAELFDDAAVLLWTLDRKAALCDEARNLINMAWGALTSRSSFDIEGVKSDLARWTAKYNALGVKQ